MDDEEFRYKEVIKALLENPYTIQAVKDIKAEIATEIVDTDPKEGATRESLYLESRVLHRVLGRLNKYANDIRMIEEKDQDAG